MTGHHHHTSAPKVVFFQRECQLFPLFPIFLDDDEQMIPQSKLLYRSRYKRATEIILLHRFLTKQAIVKHQQLVAGKAYTTILARYLGGGRRGVRMSRWADTLNSRIVFHLSLLPSGLRNTRLFGDTTHRALSRLC